MNLHSALLPFFDARRVGHHPIAARPPSSHPVLRRNVGVEPNAPGAVRGCIEATSVWRNGIKLSKRLAETVLLQSIQQDLFTEEGWAQGEVALRDYILNIFVALAAFECSPAL
jgi:hypothetical protein